MAVARARAVLRSAGTVVIAALAVARLLVHWPRIWDIEFWDESNYLAYGLRNWPDAMTRYEDFPLYSKFYHVLALALGSDDAPRLYMVGGLLVILMGLVGVGLGVWAGSKSLGAAIAAVAIVALTGSLIWPRVVFLSLFVQGVGFAASTLSRNRFTKLSVIALTSYVATFVRSEFVIGFYVAAAAAIAVGVHALMSRRPERRRGSAAGLLALSAIAGLSVLWSFPVLRSNRRAMAAFGQHYGLRFVEKHHTGMSPWANPQRIVAMDFPGAHSVLGALRVNPSALLRFFAENALGIVPRSWRSILPTHFVPWGASGLALIAVALWIACRSSARASRANELGNVLCASVLLLPPTLSVIVVFPRDHYVLQVIAAQMFLVGALARAAWRTSRARSWGPLLLAVCFLVVARPLPIVGQPNLARVAAIRALPTIGRMLESDGGLCTYAVPRCETVWGDSVPANASFARYLDENRIDAVAASPGLTRSVAIRENPSFQEFVRAATDHGWTRYEISGEHPILLFVRGSSPARQ